MSFRHFKAVLEAEFRPANEKWVLMCLAWCAEEDGTHAYRGIERVERFTGLGERTIFRALAELQHAAYVTKETAGDRGTPTRFNLNPDKFLSLPEGQLRLETSLPHRQSTRHLAASQTVGNKEAKIKKTRNKKTGIHNADDLTVSRAVNPEWLNIFLERDPRWKKVKLNGLVKDVEAMFGDAVDLESEARHAVTWLLDKGKQRTVRGMKTFWMSWLKKAAAADHAPRQGRYPGASEMSGPGYYSGGR